MQRKTAEKIVTRIMKNFLQNLVVPLDEETIDKVEEIWIGIVLETAEEEDKWMNTMLRQEPRQT